ncbi:MAG: AAA family ATPase [Prosthecobacter sp.]|uniref:AAA family ATPase n=1 Tax=Prosthecobacter sp. TaxID=1965333 RepID=UPI003BAFF3B6
MPESGMGVAADWAAQPQASIPEGSRSQAAAKASYRLLSNERLEAADIDQSHRAATWGRMASHEVVLAVADTTSFNHTTYAGTDGIGPIGLGNGSAQGFLLHSVTDLIIQLGYQVLILDNLSSLASGVDENKGMDYEPLSHWLLELRRRKITVIVVHHAGRNGMMRGHSKREDACSWIIELRDARLESDPGAKFVSHFAKPSRNTGDPLPDMLWHFTTDKTTGITDIQCELAQVSEYEQFIQHVLEGVTSQKDLAEMMDKNKGTVSKWARKALRDGRLSGGANKLLPPKASPSKGRGKIRVHASDDDFDDDDGYDQDDDSQNPHQPAPHGTSGCRLPTLCFRNGNRQPSPSAPSFFGAFDGRMWHPVETRRTFVKTRSPTHGNRKGVYGCHVATGQ